MKLTGQLGDVMKESAVAALSYLRSKREMLKLDDAEFSDYDFHVHVPAGAIPRGGPSAGVAMISAIISLVTGKDLRDYLAMTGEISLRGNVLPVGGIKEKVLAAHRAGIREVILPAKNEHDLNDVPESVRSVMDFHLVDRIEQVIALILPEKTPAKKPRKTAGKKKTTRSRKG